MDSHKKNLLSSTPIKPSSIPKPSLSEDDVEINENDQSLHQIGSKLHIPKKSMTKNFMSPTISAASKAAMPRKKILVERNGASSPILPDTHVQKTLHTDSRVSSADLGYDSISGYSSQVTPISYRVSESDDDDQNTFVPESSSQPYDPLKNYLSPRPRFLRYKPNRRLGFLLGRHSELREGEDGFRVSGCVSLESKKSIEEETSIEDYGKSSTSSSSLEGFEKQDGLSPEPLKNEEIHEGEDDDLEDVEVEEEERPWHLIEVLKYLLLLGVLILSTLYISSMNSPKHPPALEASWDFKEGYLKIKNHLFQATVENFIMGSNFFEQKLEKFNGLRELNETIDDEGIEKDEIVKQEMRETDEISDTMSGVLEIQGREFADVSDHEMEKAEEVFDKMDEILKPQVTETAEIYESLQVSQTLFISEWGDDQNSEFGIYSTSESISKAAQDIDESVSKATERVTTYEGIGIDEVVEPEMEKVENITEGMHELFRLQGREAMEITQASQKQFMLERMVNENKDSDIPTTSNTQVNSEKDEIIRPMKASSNSKVAIGVSILSVIMASLISGFFYFKRRKMSVKDSSLIVQPFPEPPVVVENSILALPSKEEQIEKVESYPNPSSSVHSKEIYQSRAPTVELLGEYVVGGEVSSSHKSRAIQSKMIESQESNFSVSQEKRSRSKVPSFSNDLHPSLSDFSATGSPSYGSFTVQGKIVRKKEGENGEEMPKVITTPVRRSSRIHNRMVMSP
ncbi:hypothetical protein HHK36_021702 [Tetracentron sinense]|uniref:Uncharacterized protein n=1 Tax=Tetracentron sinense TaxID=13715 RepID=A0A834YVK4_TETSI|nr:hypothetical protein HHK36_021702 [Tetracentron sinense]